MYVWNTIVTYFQNTQYSNRNTQYFDQKPYEFLDRNTRFLESKISKYQVFHTLNLKYQVFRAKYPVFQKLGTSTKKPVHLEYDCHIFSKYLVFQMKNLVFHSKHLVFRSKTLEYQVFQIKNFKILGFSHLKFEIIGISSETTKTFLDQQQKHSTLFINSFPNPTGESSEVIYKQI